MAYIFYHSSSGEGRSIGLIYGVHPDGDIAVPDGINFIEVPETPDRIKWPVLPDERAGTEHTSRVNPVTKSLETDFDSIPPSPADQVEHHMLNNAFAKALVAGLAEMRDLSDQQIRDWLRRKLS